MSVHNGERWLAEAIDSVLAQTFGDFEFLIHDDGSTDRSPAILAEYAARDRRIILSRGANIGLAGALNLLIGKARGELLARMDADDVCRPNRFELQVEYMDQNLDCVVLGGYIRIIDAAGRPVVDLTIPLDHSDIDRNNIRGVTSIWHPTVMMRKATVLQFQGYDESYLSAQDQDLWLRLAESGRLANLPEIVLEYRIHDRSISGSRRDRQRESCLRACEAAWARRGLTGVSFDYGDWRMADTPESRRAFFLRYGWQAWRSGYRGTWRHYALRSVALAPLSRAAWTLLIAGAIKRPPADGRPSA